MKWLLLAFFAFWATVAQAHVNDILILIQPALAGPSVDPLSYWQPQWVLWPPVVRNSDGGRLLSVSTGANWLGSSRDFQFEAVAGGGGWRAVHFSDLVGRGHFRVRRSLLGDFQTALLVGRGGSASPNALRLALNGSSPLVVPHSLFGAWPSGSLMVAEAAGWDEVAEMERSTSGRVLVVEYPPQEDVPWTRYWLRGHGWGAFRSSVSAAVVPGSRAPGLIRAGELEMLVRHPERFAAISVNVRNWPGGNRFLETDRRDGLFVRIFWVLGVVGVAIWGSVMVAQERSSQVVPTLLRAALLSPAAFDLAGLLGRFLGVEAWPVWVLLTAVVLTMASVGLSVWLGRLLPKAPPLLAVNLVGLVVVACVDPIWSFMNPHFSGVYPVALGALVGYLTGVLSTSRGVFGAIGVLALCASYRWVGDWNVLAFLGLGAWFAAGGRLGYAGLGVVFGFSIWKSLWMGGFYWAPLGLLVEGRTRGGVNAAEYVDFLLSPSLWTCVAVGLWIALFGFRFFFYQLRKLVRLDERRWALPRAATVCLAYGVVNPMFLSAGLVVAGGAACSLLFDAVLTM